MALTAGSIAFVAYDADELHRFGIVVVDALPGRTVIYFTDRRYDATGDDFDPNGGEPGSDDTGYLTWTVPAGGIASGTVVTFDDVNNFDGAPSIAAEKAGATVSAGTISRTGDFDLENGNEVLYAYTGAPNAPETFLAAFASDGFSSTNGSLTGTGLVEGTTAIDFDGVDDDVDVAAYNPVEGGQTFTSRSAMLTAINNPENWLTQDGSGDQSTDNIAPSVPFLTSSLSPINNVNFAIQLPTPVFTPSDEHTDLVLNGADAANGETFRFTGQAGNTVAMTFTGTSGTVTVTATEVSPGVYTAPLTQAQLASLGQGEFTVSATATDAFGNSSPPGTGTVTLDTVPPDAPVFVPGDQHGDGELTGPEVGNGETFTFTAEPGTTVEVTFTGPGGTITKPATEDPGNPGTFTVGLTEQELNDLGSGPLDISATATDDAGNTSDPSDDEINSIPCFLPGTRIATPSGEVAVETLAPGDLVLTADGRAVAVRFVGRRTVMPRFAGAEAANPIRIAAGALAENVPARDLFVSPNHGIVVDGVLAFASALVNGSTIAQVEGPGPRFAYYSVETEGHEVILAEGCPAETFMDHVPRAAWDNHADYLALHPEEPMIAEMDLPHAKSHRQVPAEIHAMLAERAAILAPRRGIAA